MLVTEHKALSVHRFANQAEFIEWLEINHPQADAIWMQFSKKGSSYSTVTYIDARDAALMYGWIDSVINKFDEDFYLVKFSHRRPRSIWSQVNCKVVEKLIADNKMTPYGMAEVEAAKADGRWDRAYPPQSEMEPPRELVEALEQNPKAKLAYENLKKSEQFSIIFQLLNAKLAETRERKLADYIQKLSS